MEFLEELLSTVGRVERRESTVLQERTVLREFARRLIQSGYEVYVNVKHNIGAGEEPEYLFQPDADVIAVRGNTILGLEVKGGSAEGPSLDKVYVGFGEAIFYLVNPIMFRHHGQEIHGGIFDRVYLALPSLPPRIDKDTLLGIFRNFKTIGLMTLNEGIIVEPTPNPFINTLKKNTLLRNKHVLQRYRL